MFHIVLIIAEHACDDPSKRILKGTSGRKKVNLKWKSVKNEKKLAIADLNAPNGSSDIPFQSQEFEQYGRRHFADF